VWSTSRATRTGLHRIRPVKACAMRELTSLRVGESGSEGQRSFSRASQAAAYMLRIAIRKPGHPVGTSATAHPRGDGTGSHRARRRSSDRGTGFRASRLGGGLLHRTGFTILEPGEIVAEILVPEPPGSARPDEKHSLRPWTWPWWACRVVVPRGVRRSPAGVAISRSPERVRPTPVRAKNAETAVRVRTHPRSDRRAARAAAGRISAGNRYPRQAETRRSIVEKLTPRYYFRP